MKKNKSQQQKQQHKPKPAVNYNITLIVLFLLGLFALRVILAINVKTVTYDEMSYLNSGAYLAKYFNWDLEQTVRHPPLSFYLHGIILNSFDFKSEAQRLLYARSIMLLFALLLGIYIFKFAKELYGVKAGIAALLIFTFCPNILAHSGLITTDLIVACLMFITIYYFLKYCDTGKLKFVVLTGIFLGLSFLSKYTAVLLVIILPCIALLAALKFKKRIKIIHLAVVFLLGIFILNTGYNFTGTFTSLSQYKGQLQSKLFFTVQKIFGPVPVLLPSPYVLGFDQQQYVDEIGHPSFLIGKRYYHGLWYYFPVSFLLKTPAFLVILALLSVLLCTKFKSNLRMQEISMLLVTGIFLLFVCFLNHNNAGYRYVIPILPFLYIYTARIIEYDKKWARTTVLVCLTGFGISSLLAHPHYLEYFTEFTGGSRNGYKYLLDSNLDWGQNQSSVTKYYETHQSKKFNPGKYPVTGDIMVNANNVQDVFRLRRDYKWLSGFKPAGNIEYAWLIYKLSVEDYENLAKKYPGNPDYLYYLSCIYYTNGMMDKCRDTIDRVLKLNPGYADAYNLLAKLQITKNDSVSAKQNLELAIKYNPEGSEYYSNIAWLYDRLRMPEKARLYNKLSEVTKFLGWYVVKPSTSAEYYLEKINKYPDDARWYNDLGVVCWITGDLDKAVSYLKKSIELDSYQIDYLNNLAYVYFEKGEYQAALDYISKYENLQAKTAGKMAYYIQYGKDLLIFDSNILVLPGISREDVKKVMEK